MRNKKVDTHAFFWALESVCELHRKPFSMELATQQLAAPHTVQSLTGAVMAYGFNAELSPCATDQLEKETFPAVAWLGPKPPPQMQHQW